MLLVLAANTITPASSCRIKAHGSCFLSLSPGAGTAALLKRPRASLEQAPIHTRTKLLSGRQRRKAEKVAVANGHAVYVGHLKRVESILRLFARDRESLCMNHPLKAHNTLGWMRPKPPNIHHAACLSTFSSHVQEF